MECPFCNINKEKTRIIKQTNDVFVCFSNPSLMKGHLLVVPKRHVEKLSELTQKERKEVFNTVIEFQDKITSKISSGCDIKQNYRPFQKQSELKVHHLHIHLQPRELEDILYKKSQIFETEIFKELSEDEIRDLSELFK
jgi:histidine triad (HIT) family protein